MFFQSDSNLSYTQMPLIFFSDQNEKSGFWRQRTMLEYSF